MTSKLYNKKINIWFAFFCLVLATISAGRLLGQGADFGNYIKIFTDTSISVEPAFSLFRIISVRFGGANLAFLVFNIIALSFIYKVLKVYSPYPFISFIFYSFSFYLLHEYIQIRAAVAISIFFLSIDDLKEQNFKSFLIKTLIATCFHYSSLFMIVLYLFCRLKKNKTYVILPIFLFLFDVILVYVFKNKYDVTFFLDWLIKKQQNPVIAIIRAKASFMGEPSTVFNKQYISFLFVLITMYLVCIKKKGCEKKELVIYKIFSFSVCCFFVLVPTGLTVIIYRIPEFYAPVIVIALTMIIKHIKEKLLSLIISLLYIFLLFVMFISKIGIM